LLKDHLPEQVVLTGTASAIRRTRSICSAPVRLKPVGARAVCTAATPAERRADRWPDLGSGRDRAGHRHHQQACPKFCHRNPILWMRARAAHSPLGGLGGRPATGPDPPIAKAGAQPAPAAALWLRTATRYAERAGRSDPPWPVASFARATRCHLSPVAHCTCRSSRRGRSPRPRSAGAATTRLRPDGEDILDGRVASR
jgi:hypothetical protein